MAEADCRASGISQARIRGDARTLSRPALAAALWTRGDPRRLRLPALAGRGRPRRTGGAADRAEPHRSRRVPLDSIQLPRDDPALDLRVSGPPRAGARAAARHPTQCRGIPFPLPLHQDAPVVRGAPTGAPTDDG